VHQLFLHRAVIAHAAKRGAQAFFDGRAAASQCRARLGAEGGGRVIGESSIGRETFRASLR